MTTDPKVGTLTVAFLEWNAVCAMLSANMFFEFIPSRACAIHSFCSNQYSAQAQAYLVTLESGHSQTENISLQYII